MEVHAWLIDFAQFRENCPTGIIPKWMQKVTQHNGIMQYSLKHGILKRESVEGYMAFVTYTGFWLANIMTEPSGGKKLIDKHIIKSINQSINDYIYWLLAG